MDSDDTPGTTIRISEPDPDVAPPAGQATTGSDPLDELAEDMLQVLQQLGAVERQVRETAAGVADLRRAVHEGTAQQNRAIENVRAEVVGERRGMALRMVFEPVVSALESIELFARGLDPARDQAAFAQITAVAATLANLLLALGFERFDVARGDAFDPHRMQCFGYAAGPPGVVLDILQPGYATGGVVVRPARVLIADPSLPPEPQGEDRETQSHRD